MDSKGALPQSWSLITGKVPEGFQQESGGRLLTLSDSHWLRDGNVIRATLCLCVASLLMEQKKYQLHITNNIDSGGKKS